MGDDCVCPDCDSDIFGEDPSNCLNEGECNTFDEGCVCAECEPLPVCSR